jgi:Mrp family chromosome partitioning ATPase
MTSAWGATSERLATTASGSRHGGLPAPQCLSVADGTRLLRSIEDGEGRIMAPVQFIAARGGDGASTVARDFSLICAREFGLRVLLLDLEAPGDRQAAWFARQRADPSAGFSASFGGEPAALEHLAETFALHEIGQSRLHLNRAVPGHGLTGAQWRAEFALLRRHFDLVVIDAPPLARSFEGVGLAAHVATTILVIAAEETPAGAIRALRDRIAQSGGDVAGCVMNKRRFRVPAWLQRGL